MKETVTSGPFKTVGELIEALSKCPKDAYVNIYFSHNNQDAIVEGMTAEELESGALEAVWFDFDHLAWFDSGKADGIAKDTVMVQLYLGDYPSGEDEN